MKFFPASPLTPVQKVVCENNQPELVQDGRSVRARPTSSLPPRCIALDQACSTRCRLSVMRKPTFQTLLIAAVAAVFVTGCWSKNSKANEPSLRVGWWRLQHERYAYVILPAESNFSEVAIVTEGRTIAGHVLHKPLSELLSLVETAQKQVAALPTNNPTSPGEPRRVVVTYNANGRKGFSVQGPVPELLKSIHGAPALEQLLFLLSQDQPKDYRMLDEPRPGGQFMMPPSPESR